MTDSRDTGDPGLPQPTPVPAENTEQEFAEADQDDADSFAGVDPQDDERQDVDDAHLSAASKPAFPKPYQPADDDPPEPAAERTSEERIPGKPVSDMAPPGQDGPEGIE
jgi:hypothetical protein